MKKILCIIALFIILACNSTKNLQSPRHFNASGYEREYKGCHYAPGADEKELKKHLNIKRKNRKKMSKDLNDCSKMFD